jgi:hypothetical protein
MWKKLGFATALGVLGILATGAASFAYVLTTRCEFALALLTVFLAAIFLSPVLLLIGGLSGANGFSAKRKDLAVLGILSALACVGTVQALPLYDHPDAPCHFDP